MVMRGLRLTIGLVVFLTIGALVGGPVQAQLDLGAFGAAPPQGNVEVAAEFTPPKGEEPARLFVTAEIEPGWYIYSTTQPAGGPKATRITVAESPDYEVTGEFRPLRPPKRKTDATFNMVVETHEGSVTWTAPIRLAQGVDPAEIVIRGALSFQRCTPTACLPPTRQAFAATLRGSQKVVSPGPIVGPSPEPEVTGPQTPEDAAGGADLANLEIVIVGGSTSTSLWVALGFGFLGGLILNLMPCVLPVIGLKVLAFVEQSGQSRTRALMLNLWYSLGLLSVFWLLAALAAFLNLGWGELFSFEVFNIGLAAVVFVMGLSFLGVWEIPIPGFATSGKATDLAEREGAPGAFAKGIVTTILATPCSGPFLGVALAWAVKQPPANIFAVFTAVGLGMASPYLLIGAFPKLIRFLPKPGPWMETFKQIMGFVLMATVVYLFTLIHWAYMVPTLGLLFGLWAACWWVGRTPATADFARKARAWFEAAAFAGLVWLVMFPGIRRVVPGGYGPRGLAEIMQARYQGLGWEKFTTARLEAELSKGNTVLVDFTADWCLTCKVLEATVLDSSTVKDAIASNGVVTMKADWTDGAEAVEVDAMLQRLGSKQVPQWAVFSGQDRVQVMVLRDSQCTQPQSVVAAIERAGRSKTALATVPPTRR